MNNASRFFTSSVVILFFLIIFSFPSSVFSQENKTSVLFDKAVELDFSPASAYFFIMHGEGVLIRKRATIVPPYRSEEVVPGRVKGRWLFGCRAQVPAGEKKIEYSLLVIGEEGRFAFSPPEERKRDVASMPFSVEELREHLNSRKEVLRTLETQMTEVDKKLKRLRFDVDTIADIGKIVQAREETINIKNELQNLDKDRETLNRSLKLVRTRPNPKNFVRREGELTSQLSQLVDVAKRLESAELSKRSTGESKLKRKLYVVEQTRGEDLNELQRKLEGLVRRRMELEAK